MEYLSQYRPQMITNENIQNHHESTWLAYGGFRLWMIGFQSSTKTNCECLSGPGQSPEWCSHFIHFQSLILKWGWDKAVPNRGLPGNRIVQADFRDCVDRLSWICLAKGWWKQAIIGHEADADRNTGASLQCNSRGSPHPVADFALQVSRAWGEWSVTRAPAQSAQRAGSLWSSSCPLECEGDLALIMAYMDIYGLYDCRCHMYCFHMPPNSIHFKLGKHCASPWRSKVSEHHHIISHASIRDERHYKSMNKGKKRLRRSQAW